ncbi:MAG: flagellar basal body P-ring formation protein FlgA [Deltaproteobacteria bacterium]|nr:flagellar basal body P-ring formation protein FlgA [Deltaproteobacteria bacterium]
MNFKFQISNFKFIIVIYLASCFFYPLNSFADEKPDKISVVVAIVSLGIGHIITENDVKLVMRDARDDKVLTDLNDAVGKKVFRPIGINNAIKKDYLQDAAAIKKGDAVILVAEKGNVRVSGKGKIREDGALGTAVRVENILSGKVVRGRVIEPGVVAIDF